MLLPGEDDGARSVFWMYGVRIAPELEVSRGAVRAELARQGIETRTFFVPIHLQPIYFERFRGRSFPVAETLCRTGFYLPTHESLGEDDARWIAARVAEAFDRARA